MKAGIIGLGVGEAHIKGYNEHPDCNVKMCCDFDEKAISETKSRYPNIAYTTDCDDILTDPDIDVVSIASYDNFHFDQIMKAIAHDKHVFVEKPVCIYYDEAVKIRAALDAKPYLKFSSNLILRQSERFQILKKQIDTGFYGDLYHIKGAYNYGRIHKIIDGWRGKLPFYSIVYGGGVHLLDLMLWMINSKVVEVSAYGNNIASKESSFSNMDFVDAILQFESGVIVNLSCNFACVHPHFHQFEVYGTKATFVNGLKDASIWTDREQSSAEAVNTAYPGVHKGDLLMDFLNAIKQETSPIVSKDHIFDTMSVCFAIEEAYQSNKKVKVKYI